MKNDQNKTPDNTHETTFEQRPPMHETRVLEQGTEPEFPVRHTGAVYHGPDDVYIYGGPGEGKANHMI